MTYFERRNWLGPILFLAFMLCFSVSADAQTTQHDSRIVDVYGQAYADNLKTNSKGLYDYLVYSLDNAWFIGNSGGKDISSMADVSAIPLAKPNSTRPVFDINNFNVLRYNIYENSENRMSFRVGNTGDILVFYSRTELMKRFKADWNATNN